MVTINFEKAKARKLSKEKADKLLQNTSDGAEELHRQYKEMAQFFNRWYDEHVVGQYEDGSWIYKDL